MQQEIISYLKWLGNDVPYRRQRFEKAFELAGCTAAESVMVGEGIADHQIDSLSELLHIL